MRAVNENQFMNALGKRIAEIRKANNVTQESLAADTGLDRVAIAYIETGKRKPKVSSIYKISKALEIEPSDLFKGL